MQAMVLHRVGEELKWESVPRPIPGEGEVVVKIAFSGVCRTDLHIIDGELPNSKLPLILGHQGVGKVVEQGAGADRFALGDRVGVPWLGKTCGQCYFCLHHRENLCDQPIFTGYLQDGCFAEYVKVDEDYLLPLPKTFSDHLAAPLLCAGMIGWRALKLAGNFQTIGFFGFGASAHILTQIVVQHGGTVFAFTRPGDEEGQAFAKTLGATWSGSVDQKPDVLLDCAIIFAPVGDLVPVALQGLRKGGKVVLAGIHMSDIPSFPYSSLWQERSIQSVANLTREDGREFFSQIDRTPIHTSVHIYDLKEANVALDALRQGRHKGAIVLKVE